MKKITVTGKTVEDAVKQGILELGAKEDQVHVHIIEQPSKGLFGVFGSKEAKIEIELIHDPVEEAIQFLSNILQNMNLNMRVEKQVKEDHIQLNLSGDELGIIIGRRGQTLDALQYLVNIVANRDAKHHLRLILDAEQFRERRRKTLEELAERLAGKVGRIKKEIVLEPMSPHERKVIHSYLQDHPGVKTYSKGVEPNRRVVITAK